MPRDTPATVNLLERATGLLPSYDQRRLSDRGVLGGCREVESREPEVKLVIEPWHRRMAQRDAMAATAPRGETHQERSAT
jgi:hypothetical protein